MINFKIRNFAHKLGSDKISYNDLSKKIIKNNQMIMMISFGVGLSAAASVIKWQ